MDAVRRKARVHHRSHHKKLKARAEGSKRADKPALAGVLTRRVAPCC
jgi:hypothetical protein